MTARLIGRTGKALGLEQPIAEMLIIGSAPGTGLRIESRAVSRQHAQIVRTDRDYYVEDLGSRNGTFLNRQRVRRFPIRHLDVLSLGPEVDLIFVESAGVVMSVPRPSAVRATIEWINGPIEGSVQEIAADRGLLLGRIGKLASLGAISRRHAVLTIRDGYVTVEDLGSANGTWVNTNQITTVTRLEQGDEVRLANLIRLRLSMAPAGAADMDHEGSEEPAPETVFVPDRRGERAPVLDRRSPTLQARVMSPETPHNVAVPSAPAPERKARPAVEPLADGLEIGAVPDSATTTAPRTAATVPAGIATPAPGDGTVGAPREPASAPVFGLGNAPPIDGGETVMPLREPAEGVPQSVAEAAMAARDDLAPTVGLPSSVPPAALETDQPSPVPADPAPVGPSAMNLPEIVGVRLDGPGVTLNRGTFMIGRNPDSDVRLDARDVGRIHARLDVRADAVLIEDLGTANGTFVNDEPVSGAREVPDGARVRFATAECVLNYLRSEGTTR